MTSTTKSKAGLYPELFAEALRKQIHLPVRSEKHENQADLAKLFVDNQQLELIRNPDWQVIYGRRGTGKTILLRILKERCNLEFEKDRILTVSVSAQDLLVSPTGFTVTDKQRALAYFQVFLETIAEQLVKRTEEFLGSPSFLQRITGSRKRLIDKIEDCAIQVLTLVQTGQSVDAFVKRHEVHESKTTEEESTKADAKAEGSVSGAYGSLIAKASAKMASNHKQKHNNKTREEVTRVPRFALARAKILELLKSLQITRLDIHIDEWQTLDPHAATGVQPEFAEYLKRTLFGTSAISVKIATNRYQTRFSNRGGGTDYSGLEVGADIFEATNLDRTEQSLAEQVAFYGQLIFKRLIFCEPKLKVFERDDGTPNEQFLFSIFRDEKSFQELVKGAPATPRDFLLMFNSLSHTRSFSNNPTWTITMVQDAIRVGGANLQEETDSTSEADQLLTRCIKGIVEKTGSRLFIVDRDDRHAAHDAVEELIQKRLIDSYSRAELDPDIRTAYDAFLLHYGLWLDWRPLDVSPEKYDEHEIPIISKSNADKYKVKVEEIDSDIRICPHCGDHFPTRSRPFQVAGLCPNCYQPAEKPVVKQPKQPARRKKAAANAKELTSK